MYRVEINVFGYKFLFLLDCLFRVEFKKLSNEEYENF